MNRDIRYIDSIIRHCVNIEEAIQIFGADEEDFLDNVHFQNDCAFALSQVGEIVKRLSPGLTSKHPEVEWSNIAKLRDMISHKYEGIELQVLWDIIMDDVPLLRKECEIILTELRSK
ncbi:MAG: DUF86 domain-containing protein [Methanomassiliicoccaceae archaeon]|nr:DUF86 domain-containing protein [Methanomassiliicoccaceae archaeon]